MGSSTGRSLMQWQRRQSRPGFLARRYHHRMTEHGPAAHRPRSPSRQTPTAVYALITDLPTLASVRRGGGRDEVAQGRPRRHPARCSGARTATAVRRWTTTCTVTDADPGSAFAFDVVYFGIPVSHWRYDISPAADPADGGCRVTERTWDRRPGWFVKPGGIATGVKDRPTDQRQAHRSSRCSG